MGIDDPDFKERLNAADKARKAALEKFLAKMAPGKKLPEAPKPAPKPAAKMAAEPKPAPAAARKAAPEGAKKARAPAPAKGKTQKK